MPDAQLTGGCLSARPSRDRNEADRRQLCMTRGQPRTARRFRRRASSRRVRVTQGDACFSPTIRAGASQGSAQPAGRPLRPRARSDDPFNVRLGALAGLTPYPAELPSHVDLRRAGSRSRRRLPLSLAARLVEGLPRLDPPSSPLGLDIGIGRHELLQAARSRRRRRQRPCGGSRQPPHHTAQTRAQRRKSICPAGAGAASTSAARSLERASAAWTAEARPCRSPR